MDVKRVGVLVSGRGSNLQALIDKMPEMPYEISLVISDNTRAFALQRAQAAGIQTRVIEPKGKSKTAFEQELVDCLRTAGVEIVILAGFMRLLGEVFLRQAPGPVINIHPALLPAFPGLHAQAQALNYGVKVAGCTVHFVDTGMDSGPIIAQQAVPVLESDDAESLSARILEQEHQLLPTALRLIAFGRVVLEGKKVRVLKE